jgi:hypothetical protein
MSEATNPKTEFFRRRYNSSQLDGLSDPILDEVIDLDDVKLTFQKYPIIPFFDNSDATLRFLRKMRTISPTAEACTNSIISYVVGGGLATRVRRMPGFSLPVGGQELGITDVQDQAFRDFVNNLNPVDDADKILEDIEQLTDNTLTYGNRWLMVRLSEVAGVRHAYLDAVDSEDVRYWATNPGEEKIVVISESWEHTYLEKYPPMFVGAYPSFTTDPETGDQLTIIHDRKRTLKRKWYGLPKNMGSLYWKCMEASLAEFGLRGYKKQWTAKTFFETSGDDEDKLDPAEFVRSLESMYTIEGEGAQFIHRHKLEGDSPTTVVQINPNTDHEFHESMSSLAFHKIVGSYDWNTILLSEQVPGSLGFSKEFLDIYKVKYKTVIEPIQDRVADTVNKALQIAAEWQGRTDVAGLGLGLGNMLEGFMESGDSIVEQSTQPAGPLNDTSANIEAL